MALYTFYLCQPDGSAASFEAVELADDAAAVDHAPAMLDQHRSCAYVMVWEGERRVHTRRRAERPAHDAHGSGHAAA